VHYQLNGQYTLSSIDAFAQRMPPTNGKSWPELLRDLVELTVTITSSAPSKFIILIFIFFKNIIKE
jgi:hypothetical protein